jgi:hypothetical protein
MKKKTETGSNRPVSVRFGSVFRTKTGSNRFGFVFSVWLGFFSVWVSGFRLIKPNRTDRFF